MMDDCPNINSHPSHWSLYSSWKRVEEFPPPSGVEVLARIDDGEKCRNQQVLMRSGAVWWANNMYVYYTPTHWRPIEKGTREYTERL